MSDAETANMMRVMLREITTLAKQLSPWIGVPEMEQRYGVQLKTLGMMERRGEIPMRHKGRWNRAEVIEWEARRPA